MRSANVLVIACVSCAGGGGAGEDAATGDHGTGSDTASGDDDGHGDGSAGDDGSPDDGGSAGDDGSASDAGSAGDPPDWPPATGRPGVWENVTPPDLDLEHSWGGLHTLLPDPARPTDVFVNVDAQGTWKSTDYGLTWTTVNTGRNGDMVDSGRQWYAAIDLDPRRDPRSDPVIYVTQGYGVGGLWKSTNGGVDWTNVWDGNIFAPDGVTNISADVESDIAAVYIVDPTDAGHLILSLHSYYGKGGNNGVFETTNGGQTWIVHNSEEFTFQPHADVLFPAGPTTWLVSHGNEDDTVELLRTTNAGDSWEVVDDIFIGGQAITVGSTVYAVGDALYRSTDAGASWTRIEMGVAEIYDVFASPTALYVTGGGLAGEGPWIIRRAPLDDDQNWTDLPVPAFESLVTNDDNAGYVGPGFGAAFTDGEHDIVMTSNWLGGLWRYVVP
jgi:hypothetical protein